MSPLLKAAADQGRETDTGRLGDLYLRHADGAARLAYLLTGDHALAEDLVQEAFIRLAGRLVHLRDPDAFHAYLRRTVVNLANSHFRQRRVERAYLERERGVVSGRPPVREPSGRWRIETICGRPWSSSPTASGPPSCFGSTRTCPNPASPSSCGAVREP